MEKRFIKCSEDKLLDIENEETYLGFTIMNKNITYVKSCFLREKEFDLQLLRETIIQYLNSCEKKQIKYIDYTYKDRVTLKNVSKNKCKISVNEYSVTIDKIYILNKMRSKIE